MPVQSVSGQSLAEQVIKQRGTGWTEIIVHIQRLALWPAPMTSYLAE